MTKAVSGSRALKVGIGLAALAAASAAAVVDVAARRKRVSVGAILVNTLASYLAPDLDSPDALERAIGQVQARGPALPPRGLRRTMRFHDEWLDGMRRFRLEGADGTQPLTLFYLHGGGYVFEVQSVQWSLITGLLKRLSADVVAPMYPLAPEHGWQESMDAVEQSFVALAAQVGASNIAVVGDSAGGGLALLLAQRLRDTGVELPAALVLVSPWLDIGCSGADQPAREKRDPALSIAFLRAAGLAWAKDVAVEDARVSPLFGDQAALPPTIMFSGGRDVLASDAFRLAARNPTVVHRHYDEMIHVWPAAPIPEGRRALDEAAAFIMEHVRHR